MAKKNVKAGEIVGEGEELVLARSVSTELQTFVGNLQVFVAEVRALEDRAVGLELSAGRLPETVTKKSAAKAQELVSNARAGKRDIPDTWTILKRVQALVKAMIAKRKIAELAFDSAIKVGQSHYFAWADAEKRRIAEEQETVRLAAEATARKEREKELAAIEQAALDAEAGTAELSERELSFVEYVVGGQTAVQAAAAVGYANPAARAKKLIATAKIRKAIDAKREAASIREEAAVVKSTPLDIEETATEETDLKEGRRNRSAELLDEDALRSAVIEGKYGIPQDVLMVNPVALNSYARDMGSLINRWPGVRLKTKRSLV